MIDPIQLRLKMIRDYRCNDTLADILLRKHESLILQAASIDAVVATIMSLEKIKPRASNGPTNPEGLQEDRT